MDRQWTTQLNGDPLTWLLEEENPGVRYLAMRDLLDIPPGQVEMQSACTIAHQSGPIQDVLAEMEPDGYWMEKGPGYNPKYRSTVWSICLLAQLGARIDMDARIEKACVYVLDNNLTKGGQFSTSNVPSGTVDCVQGNLCWSLLEMGCTDERLEKAFDWMARSQTGEGVAPVSDKQAAIRYYAYKCGPNFNCGGNLKLPCAWGAAKVMLAFGKLPPDQRTPVIERAIQAGVDFFFSVDPASAAYPVGLGTKPSGNWWKFGFPVFYITDLLQIVEALVSLRYQDDPRLTNAIQLIKGKQDDQGKWPLEYDYTGKTWGEYGQKGQPNKWVTLRVLQVLKAFL